MISSWGLLSFLKAADTRQGASIAVKDESQNSNEMFIEDYIAMAENNGDLPDHDDFIFNDEQYDPHTYDPYAVESSHQQRDQGMNGDRVSARRSNLRQGDIEITDFSQLEDDDL